MIYIKTDGQGNHLRWVPNPEDPGSIITTPIKPELEDPATELALSALWASTHGLVLQLEHTSDEAFAAAMDSQPTILRPVSVTARPKQTFVAERTEEDGYNVQVALAHIPSNTPSPRNIIVNRASYLIGANSLCLTDLRRDFYALPDSEGNVKLPQFTPAVIKPHIAIKAVTKCLDIVRKRLVTPPASTY